MHDGLAEIARVDAEHPGFARAVLAELPAEDAADIWARFCHEEQAVAAAEHVVALARFELLHPPDEEDPEALASG